MIQDELTYQIIGGAMEVHMTLGNGFTDSPAGRLEAALGREYPDSCLSQITGKGP